MPSKALFVRVAALAACVPLLGACKSASFDDQRTMVDDSKAGTAAFDTMFDDAVAQMINEAAVLRGAVGQLNLAVMTVKSSTGAELGPDTRPYVQEGLGTSLQRSGVFTVMSRERIAVGLNEAGVSSEDQLLIPRYGRAFLAVFEGQGTTPDYVLFPTLTASGSKDDGWFVDQEQKTYRVTLKLVDVGTGEELVNTQRDLAKTYSDIL